jgi:outer membrane lipoprotein-sorting protein
MIRRLGVMSAVCVGVLCLALWCEAAEFSADTITTTPGMSMNGKLFVQGKKIRQEVNMGSMKHIVIFRPDKNVTWMLDPKSKTYVEMPARPRMMDPSILKDEAEMKKLGVKKNLGTEKVNGFVCDKFRLTYKDKSMGSSTVWVSKQLEWPLKTESKGPRGTMVAETKNIKVGKLPSSLFEIPKGYKKTSMPQRPGMGGMPRPGAPGPKGLPHRPK